MGNAQKEPIKRKKSLGIIDVLLTLVIIASLGYAGYSFFREPQQLEIPEATVQSVDPSTVQSSAPAIEGSNSGSDTPGQPGNDDEVAGSDGISDPGLSLDDPNVVEVPAFGNDEDGQEGNLTKEKTRRSTEGVSPITQQMKDSCPGMANGSICVPSMKKVTHYHSVGTYRGSSDVLKMRIPSTFSAGWLNTTSKVGASEGTSLFAAHVIYNGGQKGAFYHVPKMKSGMDVIVRNMKGENYLYRVYRVDVVNKDELPDELFETEGAPKIALVTCTGDWVNRHYQQRSIVWASPVQQVG